MRITAHTTLADRMLICALLLTAALLFLVLPQWVISGNDLVEIRSDKRVVGRYSLDRDRIVEVAGPVGTTVVEISAGRARIRSSPCPHKICTQMGSVGKEGGIVVCVPNRVIVETSRKTDNGLDAVSK